MDDELYPVMSPSLWKKFGYPDKPAQLNSLKLLHDRDPEASWGHWQRTYGPENLDLQRGPRFASSDLVLCAAAQGQGVALARHQLARNDIATGVLIRPFPGLSVPIKEAYWIVLQAHKKLRPATLKVAAWLKMRALSAAGI